MKNSYKVRHPYRYLLDSIILGVLVFLSSVLSVQGVSLVFADTLDATGGGSNITTTIGLKGSGTESSPYLIDSIDDFKLIDEYRSKNSNTKKYFKQTSDILYENYYDPTTGTTNLYSLSTFYDVYDGDNHSIVLTKDNVDYTPAPLFNVVNATGVVKNVIISSTISTYIYPNTALLSYTTGCVGIIAGQNYGTIENITVDGGKYYLGSGHANTSFNAGIIVGQNGSTSVPNAIVTKCVVRNNASIIFDTLAGLKTSTTASHTEALGGVVGLNHALVAYCAVGCDLEVVSNNTNAVKNLHTMYMGGIIGVAESTSTLTYLVYSGYKITCTGSAGINATYSGDNVSYISGITTLYAVPQSAPKLIISNAMMFTAATSYSSDSLQTSASIYNNQLNTSILSETYAFDRFYSLASGTGFALSTSSSYIENLLEASNTNASQTIFDSLFSTNSAFACGSFTQNGKVYSYSDTYIHLKIELNTRLLSGAGTYANPYVISSINDFYIMDDYQSSEGETQVVFTQTGDIIYTNYYQSTESSTALATRYLNMIDDVFYDVYLGNDRSVILPTGGKDFDVIAVPLIRETGINSIVKDIKFVSNVTTYISSNEDITDYTLNNKIMDGKYHYGRGASLFIQIHNGLLENIDFVGGDYILGSWDSDDVLMESGILVAAATDTSVIRNIYFADDVSVAFDIDGSKEGIYSEVRTDTQSFGAVVGTVSGVLENVSMNADLTFITPSGSINKRYLQSVYYFGGVFGSTYNANAKIGYILFTGDMVIDGNVGITKDTTGYGYKYFLGIGFNNFALSTPISNCVGTTETIINNANKTSSYSYFKIQSTISNQRSSAVDGVYYSSAFYSSLSSVLKNSKFLASSTGLTMYEDE